MVSEKEEHGTTVVFLVETGNFYVNLRKLNLDNSSNPHDQILRACLFFSIYYTQMPNLKEKAEKLKLILRSTNPLSKKPL